MPAQRTTTDRTRWINVPETTDAQLATLQRELPMLDSRDLHDCLPPQQRPKFVRRERYVFLILLFPRYLREEHAIVTEEVDIILTPETVATVHTDRLPVFREFAAAAPLAGDAATMFFEILERLLDYCAPILVHLQNDLEEQERHVRAHATALDVTTTALLRRNVVACRRAFGPNAHAIAHLRDALHADGASDTHARLDRIIDTTHEALLLLEELSGAIAAIHATQQSLVTFRTNRAMTALTVIAVITFPLSLLAALFSMNTVATPLVGHPNDFWIIVGGMVAIALAMLGWFKRQGWM